MLTPSVCASSPAWAARQSASWKIVRPRVGLLNIGHEPSKGPDVVREAARLIEAESDLDFRGFVEADRVFSGDVDLVVCDGFAGNVLLKSAEGMARLLSYAAPRCSDGLAWCAASSRAGPRV